MILKSKLRKLELRGTIIGMVLGDGSLSKPANTKQNSRLSIGHSKKQESYLIHKFDRVQSLLKIPYKHKNYQVFNKKTNKKYSTVQGSTTVHRYLTKLRKLLYKNDTKTLTERTLNYLTPEGLAYWYMDDGGVKVGWCKTKKCFKRASFLSTQSFTYEEHKIIQKWFMDKYQIECKIHNHGKGKFRICFNATNSKKLFNIIGPFVLDCMKYKLDLKYCDKGKEKETS